MRSVGSSQRIEGWVVAFLAAVLLLGAALGEASSPTPEARAVGFLTREVPAWSRENRCFSCHNNGDAARALYEARRIGLAVPAASLAETTAWLARPSGWDHNGSDGPFSDKRLARVAFASALATAIRTGAMADRAPLREASARLARDQAEDGSWRFDGENDPGSPAAYGRVLATLLARELLEASDPSRFQDAIARADGWLSRREIAATADAATVLMSSWESADRRRSAIGWLSRAQSEDGGWGPYAASPPEPFDTALALLGLSRCGDRSEKVRRMIAQGRRFLIAGQQEDGSWPETTRPAGGTSYAQRISTAGWATLALMATRGAERH